MLADNTHNKSLHWIFTPLRSVKTSEFKRYAPRYLRGIEVNSMKHVFISYVSEDLEAVENLCKTLRSRGVEVWLDRDDIMPGEHWETAIRRAIADGAFFFACFSDHYHARERTYMNTELSIAVDEAKQRSGDRAWFIPVRLTQCEIPDRPIGGGETLRALQWVDLFSDWNTGLDRILHAIGVSALSELEQYTTEINAGRLIEQWCLLAEKPGALLSNTYYALKNTITNKALECGFVTKGIQLVWGEEPLRYPVAFEKADASNRSPLRFGDKVAILMKGKGYLVSRGRGYGINLAWSKTPNFQWLIGPENAIGEDLSTECVFRLFNTVVGECVLHYPRSNGVSLRWESDFHSGRVSEAPSWKRGHA